MKACSPKWGHIFFPSNAFMASARSLHMFDRSKRWVEIIVQGCQLSIATKVLVMDLYAVQYAIPARKPKTQNKPQKQTSKPNKQDKRPRTSNKPKQKQKQNNQKNIGWSPKGIQSKMRTHAPCGTLTSKPMQIFVPRYVPSLLRNKEHTMWPPWPHLHVILHFFSR